jgi:hypothetical protein
MFRNDRPRFDVLASEIEELEEGIPEGPQLTSGNLDQTNEETAEDEEDDEGPGPEVENYPSDSVERAISVAIDGYVASQQQSVLQTLKEVLNRLDVMAGDNALEAALQDPDQSQETRQALSEIVDWAHENEHLLESES